MLHDWTLLSISLETGEYSLQNKMKNTLCLKNIRKIGNNDQKMRLSMFPTLRL